jgi:hypothetical protein
MKEIVMNTLNNLFEHWLTLLPLFLLQAALAGYCIRKIVKDGVRNLSKPIWILMVVFLNLVGPVLYILAGQKED